MNTPLITPDANGNSGRDYMNRARMTVEDLMTWRQSDDPAAAGRTARYREDAAQQIQDAWRHPEAAKAMRAAGFTEDAMRRDLAAGNLERVVQGLSALDPAVVERKQVDQARDVARADAGQDRQAKRAELVRQATDFWGEAVASGKAIRHAEGEAARQNTAATPRRGLRV